ncbi:hypothetical protein [Tenacibaculum amylolyticum]|uniref:hypothetical protein n=1 Tax=Tenacibaculum amylolyticum TaxID=104269 RepID=UPI00389302FA
MKTYFYILLLISTINVSAQIDASSLLSAPRATTAELNAITSPAPQLGSIAFDTDRDRLVEYTSGGWREILTDGNVYVGAFIISSSGNQNITGVPFEPSQITFVAHANVESLNLNSDNGVGNNNTGINNSYGTMNGFARDNGGPITQQVIYVGGSGNSINDISRYASSSNCIGLRYGNQNGDNLGIINASLTSFNSDGFTINVARSGNATSEGVVVIFTAYK